MYICRLCAAHVHECTVCRLVVWYAVVWKGVSPTICCLSFVCQKSREGSHCDLLSYTHAHAAVLLCGHTCALRLPSPGGRSLPENSGAV